MKFLISQATNIQIVVECPTQEEAEAYWRQFKSHLDALKNPGISISWVGIPALQAVVDEQG